MTARHRKGKNNHKHEENFLKNEVLPESEVVRAAGSGHAPLLLLFLLLVVGGAVGAWVGLEQHQTLGSLTDTVTGMQMKVVRLQSSHEEMRQSGGKHLSESLENRLVALEESYALAQKQVGVALATAEQLRTSDLPAQVLSLHTEMKARLAEMRQATVSLEQLSQLQDTLRGKSEEFDGVRVQVEGLAALSAELAQRTEVLSGSLGDAESSLEEGAGQVAALSGALDHQAAEVLGLKEQVDAQQARLTSSALELTTVRELLDSEASQRLQQQLGVEEQLSSVQQSLRDQSSAAQSLHSELRAQLDDIQTQVAQLELDVQPPAEREEQTAEETAPAAQEEAAAATEEEEEEEEEEGEEVPAIDVEKEAEEQEEAAEKDEAPDAPAEEEEEEEEEAEQSEEKEEEELPIEETKKADDDDEEEESEGESVEEENHQAEGEKILEEEEAGEEEEEQEVASDGEEPLETDASPEAECK